MNTKIIVALVVGIALVGLTGAASAGIYQIDGNYVYSDGAINNFATSSNLNVELDGMGPNGYFYMHNFVDNEMAVSSVSSPDSNVLFGFVQGGVSTLTIETDMPGNLNTFESVDVAYQEIEYVASGDAFGINLQGTSLTHAGTHEGILPIGGMDVWDHNMINAAAGASGYMDTDDVWVQEASIKSGNMGYRCETHGEGLMEAEHILGPVTAGSGITAWSNADGEIWEIGGEISNSIAASQDVSMGWWTPTP